MITIITMSGVVLLCSAQTANCDCGRAPVIYVLGHQTVFKTDENGDRIAFFSDDDEAVDAAIKEAVPLFIKALTLGTDAAWNEYYDRFLELFPPFYEDFAPRPDGSVAPGTDVNFYWDYDSLSTNHDSNYAYEYEYLYDYRVSLFDEAAKLNDYIEAVKAKTGHDKVILMSRCGGTNLAATYLSVYQKPINYTGVEKVVFMCGNLLGADFMEALLSGKLQFNAEAFYRWVRTYDLTDFVGEEAAQALYTVLDAIEGMACGTEGVCALLQKLYEKLKDDLLAPFLKCNWGINAGFVAFVNENYEDYKSYIFSEEGDLEKYAVIIDYLDRYHYEVQAKTEEDLLAMRAAGVEVDTVVYYGDQTYPFTESASLTSDTVTSVTDQSCGGTASMLTGTLSRDYIAAREAEGKGKYISPDRQIDASTGLFPDATWYVKNAHHVLLHEPIDRLMMTLARTKNADVDSVPGYPQFLNYNTETRVMSPLQEKNENDIDWAGMEKEAKLHGVTKLLRMVIDFFQKLLDRFTSALHRLRAPALPVS